MRKHPHILRTTTKLKKLLETHNLEIRMSEDRPNVFEIYLYNKIERTTAVYEGKTFSLVIGKIYQQNKKRFTSCATFP